VDPDSDDPAMRQQSNPVGEQDGGGPVGNHQGRGRDQHLAQGRLDER